MLEKVSRLYEQGADDFRIETYLKHWWRWVRSGVVGLGVGVGDVGLRFWWGLMTCQLGFKNAIPNLRGNAIALQDRRATRTRSLPKIILGRSGAENCRCY